MKPGRLCLTIIASCVVLATVTQSLAQPRRRSPRVVSNLTDIVWSVKFSPNNRTLAIARGAGNTGRVELWNTETGTLRHSIKGFDGTVWSISFTPDSRTLVSASGGIHSNKIQDKITRRNGTPFVELKWWDTETGDLKQRVELPGEDRVSLMAVHSPDGRSLAIVEYRAAMTASTFGMSDPGVVQTRIPMPMPISRSIIYDADLKLLDAGTGELRLKLKGSLAGYQMPLYGNYSMSEMFSMYGMGQRRQPLAFSPDGQLVAAWNAKEIKLWSTSTGEEVRRLKDFKGRLIAVAFSGDGLTLAAAITKFSVKNDRPDFKSEIRVWDSNTGTAKQVMPITTQSISSVVFAANGRQLLIGGLHREDTHSFATMELADLQTGSVATLESREEGTASAVVPSPDGQMIAFQTDVSTVR